MRQRVAAGRVAGGKAKSNASRAKKALPAGLKTAVEWQSMLGLVAGGVLSGRLAPGVGHAVANLARAYKDLAELGRLEEQVTELERLLRRGRAS